MDQKIFRLVNIHGADVCFEAVGKEASLAATLALARSGGKVLVTSVFDGPVWTDAMRIVRQELTVVGAWTCVDAFAPTIELLRFGKLVLAA